jgi:hypothetical protein
MTKLLSLIAGLTLAVTSVQAQKAFPEAMFTGAQTYGITSAVPVTITLATPTTIAIDPRYGMGIMVVMSAAVGNTTTSNLTFQTKVSFDGTTWSTTGAPSFTVALNQSNTVRGFYQIPASTLSAAQYIALDKIVLAATNNATAITVSEAKAWAWR